MDCSSGQVPRLPRAGLHLQPPQNFPWQRPTFSGTASDFSLLVQKLPVLLQEQGNRNALSVHPLLIFSCRIKQHFNLAGSRQHFAEVL